MPKKIIIIRHGQTDHNLRKLIQGHLDTELNENGKEQARQIAQELLQEKINVIFSSDLKRAFNTAVEVGKTHCLNVIKTTLLRERAFGKLQGVPFLTISDYFPDQDNITAFSLSEDDSFNEKNEYGVETDEQMMERINGLDRLMCEYSDKTVLLVTHGGLVRMLMRHYLGFSAKHVSQIHIPNAKPIILNKVEGKYVLKS